jgi:hypothetical protein
VGLEGQKVTNEYTPLPPVVAMAPAPWLQVLQQ